MPCHKLCVYVMCLLNLSRFHMGVCCGENSRHGFRLFSCHDGEAVNEDRNKMTSREMPRFDCSHCHFHSD